MIRLSLPLVLLLGLTSAPLQAADPPPIVGGVEGQPVAANAARVIKALEFLGTPLPAATSKELTAAIDAKDAKKVQQVLDSHVLFVLTLNPEARMKVARGPAEAKLQQAGYTPVLYKVINESTVKKRLRILSPQAGAVYSGAGRQEKDPKADPKVVERFLQLETFTSPPMTAELSGLGVEYAIALIYSSEAGKREATIGFDVGQGSQDLGFRGEVPVLFDVKPAIKVNLKFLTSMASRRWGGSCSPMQPATSFHLSRNDWPPTSSSSGRYTAPMAGTFFCPRGSSRWSMAAGRSTG